VGTNGADENIQVILNFDDEGFSFASINIRGLPSEEIIVSTTAIDF
jgi:hypothetical protein